MRSVPARSISAVAGVRCTRERRPWRSVRSQPAVTLRASARRAAGCLWSSVSSAAMSVSCQALPEAGRTYSPRSVSRTDRAAGAPTLRRRSCSFTRRTLPARDESDCIVTEMSHDERLPDPARIVLRRRIEWMDTDAAGIYHWTTAFRLAEAAEAALHTALGIADITFGASPRVAVSATFTRPLRFNDAVDVELTVRAVGRTSVEYGLAITGAE